MKRATKKVSVPSALQKFISAGGPQKYIINHGIFVASLTNCDITRFENAPANMAEAEDDQKHGEGVQVSQNMHIFKYLLCCFYDLFSRFIPFYVCIYLLSEIN